MNNSERVHLAQCLMNALGLIEHGWAKQSHARLIDGSPCCWWNWQAKQFSLYGALRRCCNLSGEFTDICKILHGILANRGGYDIITFNDNEATTYDMIYSLVEDAIYIILPGEKEEVINGVLVTKKMKNDWKHDKSTAQSMPSLEQVYWLGYVRGNGRGIIGEVNGM